MRRFHRDRERREYIHTQSDTYIQDVRSSSLLNLRLYYCSRKPGPLRNSWGALAQLGMLNATADVAAICVAIYFSIPPLIQTSHSFLYHHYFFCYWISDAEKKKNYFCGFWIYQWILKNCQKYRVVLSIVRRRYGVSYVCESQFAMNHELFPTRVRARAFPLRRLV